MVYSPMRTNRDFVAHQAVEDGLIEVPLSHNAFYRTPPLVHHGFARAGLLLWKGVARVVWLFYMDELYEFAGN